jgi:hypothetical protein
MPNRGTYAMTDDERAIRDMITRQFASLNWRPGKVGEWDTFTADFLPDASLYAAARPVKAQSAQDFVERMKGLAGSKLRSFAESLLGVEVRIFGNVAVAVAGCEITENDADANRGVEMMLLVKEEGVWRIAAQAWDMEADTKRLPTELLASR